VASHKQMVPVLGYSWAQTSRPGANAQATATQAAPGINYQLVCTGITVILTAGSSNPSANTVNVSLIDGVSGGTTYLWGAVLGVPATAGLTAGISRHGLWIASANGPMTLEFAAAAGANTIESISFEGFVQRSY
jgi:hypothetical protein